MSSVRVYLCVPSLPLSDTTGGICTGSFDGMVVLGKLEYATRRKNGEDFAYRNYLPRVRRERMLRVKEVLFTKADQTNGKNGTTKTCNAVVYKM